MQTILKMIDEIEKELEYANRVPAGVFVMLTELREEVINHKCIHEQAKEWAENTTADY